jgi:hypothetical protein
MAAMGSLFYPGNWQLDPACAKTGVVCSTSHHFLENIHLARIGITDAQSTISRWAASSVGIA